MRPAGSTISIPTKLLATGVACAIVVVVCGTAATVVVAADVTTALDRGGRVGQVSDLSRVASLENSFRDTGATARALDSLVAPLGVPKPVSVRTLQQLSAFHSVRGRSDVWESASVDSLPGPIPEFGRLGRRGVAGILVPGTNAQTVPGSTDRQVVPGTNSANAAWLPLFREWARGPRRPALWGYKPGLPGVKDMRDLPVRAFGPWRALLAENERASLVALGEGKLAPALEHARENIAASRQFVDQPLMIDALIGRIYLRRGLQLLARISTASGDSATATRALQLDESAKHFADGLSLKQMVEDEKNADSHSAELLIANRSVHPALRIEAMSIITLGGCHHLPELVFGFSKKRRATMARAVASVADIDRGPELALQQQKFLEYAMNLRAPTDTVPIKAVLSESALLSTFSWIVPPGVRARAELCMQQGV